MSVTPSGQKVWSSVWNEFMNSKSSVYNMSSIQLTVTMSSACHPVVFAIINGGMDVFQVLNRTALLLFIIYFIFLWGWVDMNLYRRVFTVCLFFLISSEDSLRCGRRGWAKPWARWDLKTKISFDGNATKPRQINKDFWLVLEGSLGCLGFISHLSHCEKCSSLPF